MIAQGLVAELKASKEFFDRSTRCLKEEHSDFAPHKNTFTAAQQVAHVAQTVDWFLEGASRPEGFDLDFQAHIAKIQQVKSLAEARKWLDSSYKKLIDFIGNMSDEELQQPLPAGPVMGGAPKLAIAGAIMDHTAHHRGALTVYSRLLDLTPAMPYMETQPA